MVISNDTIKVLHVLSACLFLGNVVVSGTWALMAERTRNFEVISFSNRLVLITDLLFTMTGALLVVYTGSLMSQRYLGVPDAPQVWITWSYRLLGAVWGDLGAGAGADPIAAAPTSQTPSGHYIGVPAAVAYLANQRRGGHHRAPAHCLLDDCQGFLTGLSVSGAHGVQSDGR